jgi:hypothetical protein
LIIFAAALFAVYEYFFEQAKPNFIYTQKYRQGSRSKQFRKGTSNSTNKITQK